MQAKLPAMRKNRKIQSTGSMTVALGTSPVISDSTSVRVGESVKVNIVASRADHTSVSTKASHGTPGRKYLRVDQSMKRIGDAKLARSPRATTRTKSAASPQIQPTSMTARRTIPAQKSQMLLPASHHASVREVRKDLRLDLKGTV